MKLDCEFYKLPLRFDVERLTEEAATFRPHEWRAHPSGYKGNSSIPLISLNGEINDDFNGPMKPTPFLQRCPYIQQILASFNEVFSRSRLMRLEGNSEVSEHCDINYHWYSRVRIHVPILTYPEILFYCGDKYVHMGPGETWIFDSWKTHRVVNDTAKTRIHLVMDTCGSAEFWDLVGKSERPCKNGGSDGGMEPRCLPYEPGKKVKIPTERFNAPLVMSPGETDALIAGLLSDVKASPDNDANTVAAFIRILNEFRRNWRRLWSLYGTTASGWPHYQQLIDRANAALPSDLSDLELASNGASAIQTFHARVLYAALNPEFAELYSTASNPEKRPQPKARTTDSSPANDAQKSNSGRKVGRNQPCPCGSGKKFKYCHG